MSNQGFMRVARQDSFLGSNSFQSPLCPETGQGDKIGNLKPGGSDGSILLLTENGTKDAAQWTGHRPACAKVLG